MAELDKNECTKILQVALKQDHVKLVSHKLVPSIPDGFNGLYFTLIINYQSGHAIKELTCFLKAVPRNERHFWYIEGTKLLLKEYEMYGTLIPMFEKFINFPLPVPRCYHVRYVPEDQFQNVIVMEDLKQKGFVMKNPRGSMTLSECRAVLRALAALHAGSVVTQEKGQPLIDLCKYPQEALWVTDPSNPAFPWLRSAIDTILEVVEKMEDFKPRLESPEARSKFIKAWEDTVELMKPSSQYNNVICHGDIWSNNIMFRYEHEAVAEVRIVDLQVYRYAPPMTDVLMFIHLNCPREVRALHQDGLIADYAGTLRRLVEGARCVLPPGLGLPGLREQARRFGLYAVVTTAGYVPMNRLPPEARIKRQAVDSHLEGARDFDVLHDFLNSRSAQVWSGMTMDQHFYRNIRDVIDELLTYIDL